MRRCLRPDTFAARGASILGCIAQVNVARSRRLPVDLLISLALFTVQAILIAPVFAGEFTSARGSIEGAYITDARFIVDHFPDLSWNPLWYLGFPFEWFYTPLLPALVAILGKLGAGEPHAYRLVAATGFALGPPALYLATRQIARLPLAGAFAALAFVFVPSASCQRARRSAAPRSGGGAASCASAPSRACSPSAGTAWDSSAPSSASRHRAGERAAPPTPSFSSSSR